MGQVETRGLFDIFKLSQELIRVGGLVVPYGDRLGVPVLNALFTNYSGEAEYGKSKQGTESWKLTNYRKVSQEVDKSYVLSVKLGELTLKLKGSGDGNLLEFSVSGDNQSYFGVRKDAIDEILSKGYRDEESWVLADEFAGQIVKAKRVEEQVVYEKRGGRIMVREQTWSFTAKDEDGGECGQLRTRTMTDIV